MTPACQIAWSEERQPARFLCLVGYRARKPRLDVWRLFGNPGGDLQAVTVS